MKINKKKLSLIILLLILTLKSFVWAGPGDGSGGGHMIPLGLESSSIDLSPKPSIKLEFNKNVVNFKVRDSNKKAIKLYDEKDRLIPIQVDMKDDQVEPDRRREVFVSPKNNLSFGKYKLIIEKNFSSKSDMTLEKRIEIDFNVDKVSDIDKHWAKKDIENLNKKGIMKGLGNGDFNPNGNITKGELSAILSRLLKLSKWDGSSENTLNNKWYEDDLRKNVQAGIMSYGSGDAKLSREEFVSYIAKSFDYKKLPKKGSKLNFKDKGKIGREYEKYVENMVAYGIIYGDENGNFNPQSKITRGEVATIINRALKYLN